MRRVALWIVVGFLPVFVLGFLFPERLFAPPEGSYVSVTGADIVAFVQKDCPHCAAFEAFAYENRWNVEYHEVSEPESQELFQRVRERVPTLQQGVPTLVLDGHVLQGYETDDESGERIRRLYDACKADGCTSFDDFLKSSDDVIVESATQGICEENCEEDLSVYVLDVWLLGEVNLLRLSLPTLSILLGFLDGFNPCAMWVLITLLSLLVTTRDMRKILIVGGTFLFVSGAMYYLFIAAWLNVFLLIGYNVWVQAIIGVVAVGAGSFYLYEAFGKDPNTCNVTSMQQRRKIIERMQSILRATAWPAMLLGVSILAISVNAIELVCTAGLPAVFTQVLAFNHVSDLARYLYIALYILLYMIDDTVIFLIAVITLHATGMTTKYRRFTLIVGGLLMYLLGILMLFAPEALRFG